MSTCEGSADSRLPCVILCSVVCLVAERNHMEDHFRGHVHLYTSVPLVIFDVIWCVCCMWMSFIWSDVSRFRPIRDDVRDDVRDNMYVNENDYVEMWMCM